MPVPVPAPEPEPDVYVACGTVGCGRMCGPYRCRYEPNIRYSSIVAPRGGASHVAHVRSDNALELGGMSVLYVRRRCKQEETEDRTRNLRKNQTQIIEKSIKNRSKSRRRRRN